MKTSGTDRTGTILVVEDDENILNLLSAYLQSAGHHVVTATTGDSGLEKALKTPLDVCILDVMLPGCKGTDIATAMRESGSHTPILFLSALGNEADILKGFGAGADDYMVKPFSPRELLERIKVILRRNPVKAAPEKATLEAGPITVDATQPLCSVDGVSVDLTPHELTILRRLMSRPSWIFERGSLIASIYGNDSAVSPKAIDVHVHNLRAKLGTDAGQMIQTVRGYGYKLCPMPNSAG